MKWSNIVTVYTKELRDSLRDRRTLLSTIIIPTIAMPVMIFGFATVARKVDRAVKQETPVVMVIGGDDSPAVLGALKESKKLRVVPFAADYEQQITDKKLRAAVKIPEGFAMGLSAGSAAPVVISHYQGEVKSRAAADEIDRFFRELRDREVTAALTARALPPTFAKPFEISRRNVAPPERVGGNMFGGFVPYLIIILCFTGAMYPAMDLSAGEKERGTMETLLCSPALRSEIVFGKFLMVLTGSLGAMTMSLVSMGVSSVLMGFTFASGRAATAGAAVATNAMPTIDPLGILGVLAMVVPVAVLFSAVTFTVSLFARTMKEAQSYLGPMIFMVLGPAMIGLLPGIDLNARLALVPLLNLSLVCKEMLSGVWNWHYIGLIFGSSCVYATVALGLAVKMFNRESVIFRT